MRQIMFRGKRCDTNEWTYGGYVESKESECFIVSQMSNIDKSEYGRQFYTNKVRKETVCQFVGIKDSEGTPIYEYDVVKISPFSKSIGVIIFDTDSMAFMVDWVSEKRRVLLSRDYISRLGMCVTDNVSDMNDRGEEIK
jgi:uncharacterized phage protein (TIGR01671 family)